METVKEIKVSDTKTRSVLRFPFSGIENAYVIVSFKSQQISREHMYLYTRFQEPYYPGEPFVSFFYAGPTQGAEWAPETGPIMLYTKCSPDWKGTTFHGSELTAKEHWFYDYVEDNALAWSQLAVEDEQLPRKLAQGDFSGIYWSLKKWATRQD